MSELTVISKDRAAELFGAILEAQQRPGFDANLYKETYTFYRLMVADAAQDEYWIAMKQCQDAMEPIRKDAKNPQTNSKYAKVSTVQRIIQPIYREHGFAISWTGEEDADASVVRLVAVVSHKGGHREKYRLQGRIDNKGAKGGDQKTEIQGTMSSSSYLRRKLYELIFDLILTDDDDDGNLGKAKQKVSQEQADVLNTLLNDIGWSTPEQRKPFFVYVTPDGDKTIGSVAEVTALKFDKAVTMLQAKARKGS